MNVPYDTGKVKIGINYQPKPYIEYDKDMLKLQNCLLKKKLKINFYNFYKRYFMDNLRIEYLNKVIQDLKIKIINLRLQNVDVQTQAKLYKSYADQLEGELTLLKQTLQQKSKK